MKKVTDWLQEQEPIVRIVFRLVAIALLIANLAKAQEATDSADSAYTICHDANDRVISADIYAREASARAGEASARAGEAADNARRAMNSASYCEKLGR